VELSEDVVPPGDQRHAIAGDVGERAKAIHLQLEVPVVAIEGLPSEDERHGGEAHGVRVALPCGRGSDRG
jgi:hypothetical protein